MSAKGVKTTEVTAKNLIFVSAGTAVASCCMIALGVHSDEGRPTYTKFEVHPVQNTLVTEKYDGPTVSSNVCKQEQHCALFSDLHARSDLQVAVETGHVHKY